jgi:hypothetical protein
MRAHRPSAENNRVHSFDRSLFRPTVRFEPSTPGGGVGRSSRRRDGKLRHDNGHEISPDSMSHIQEAIAVQEGERESMVRFTLAALLAAVAS